MTFLTLMQSIGNAVDILGVALMLIGVILATIWFFKNLAKHGIGDAYVLYRTSVGKAILLGLEFLVAGDIIRTVAVSPTALNVAVLGGIVLIRTFLSMALQLEIDGKLPWRAAATSKIAQ